MVAAESTLTIAGLPADIFEEMLKDGNDVLVAEVLGIRRASVRYYRRLLKRSRLKRGGSVAERRARREAFGAKWVPRLKELGYTAHEPHIPSPEELLRKYGPVVRWPPDPILFEMLSTGRDRWVAELLNAPRPVVSKRRRAFGLEPYKPGGDGRDRAMERLSWKTRWAERWRALGLSRRPRVY